MRLLFFLTFASLLVMSTVAEPAGKRSKYVIQCRSSATGAYVTLAYARTHKETTQCWRTLRRY